jgi:hypothetical protein
MDTLVAFSTQTGFVTRPLVLFFVLLGFALGLRRTALARGSQVATWLAIAVPLLAWFLLMNWVGQSDLYRSIPWTLRLAILAPPLLWLVLLMRSARIAAVLDAIPQSWLIGLQVYRTLGYVFLVLWAAGRAPAIFALPGGIGDAVTGILALPVALYVQWRKPYWRIAGYAWNLFGLADFAIGLSIAFFVASPGLRYPVIMIPTFMVPLSIILHSLSLWQLTRAGEREGRPSHLATALAG